MKAPNPKRKNEPAITCQLWSSGDPTQPDAFSYRLTSATVTGNFATFDILRSEADMPRATRKTLLDAGVINPPSVDLLKEIFDAAEEQGLRGHRFKRPGWHGDTFIPFGGRGTIKLNAKEVAYVHEVSEHRSYLSSQTGTLEEWKTAVAAPALSSAIVSYAIMCAFAAPLARHAGLAEGVMYCIAGPSSTGKTTALKVAASVSGNPDLIAPFNFTPTAIAEIASAHSDHLLVVDDTENVESDVAKSIDSVTHMLTSGQEKKRSAKWNSVSPTDNWFTLALMTSPAPLNSILKSSRTTGKQVRLIEISVPEGRDGVFDSLVEGETSAELAQQFAKAIHSQHGTAFAAWVPRLPKLAKRVGTGVQQAAQKYETQRGHELTGAQKRALLKLLLPVWAAKEAAQAGILPWKEDGIDDVADAIINPVLDALRDEQGGPQVAWAWLADAITKGEGFFDITGQGCLPRNLRTKLGAEFDIGILRQEDGELPEVGLTQATIDALLSKAGPSVRLLLPEKPKQCRLPMARNGQARTRLYWLTSAVLENMIQEHAGARYRRWRVTKEKRAKNKRKNGVGRNGGNKPIRLIPISS